MQTQWDMRDFFTSDLYSSEIEITSIRGLFIEGSHFRNVFPLLLQPIPSLLSHLCNKLMDDGSING